MIVVPDLHGRKDLLESVLDARSEGERTIFLGDYVDPYWYEGFTREDAKECLERVISLKMSEPESIVLLIGNHDCNYAVPGYDTRLKSRYDTRLGPELVKIYQANRELFKVGHIETINGKPYIFSHAGITKKWVSLCKSFLDIAKDPVSIIEILNSGWMEEDPKLYRYLQIVGVNRGGYSPSGSIVWADLGEHIKKGESYPSIFQVFGHTQLLDDPAVWDNWACLDCRKAFRINDQGEITSLSDPNVKFKSVEKHD